MSPNSKDILSHSKVTKSGKFNNDTILLRNSQSIFKFANCPNDVLYNIFFSNSGSIVLRYMDIAHFMHPSVDLHLGCFCFLTIRSHAAVKVRVQCVCGHLSPFLWDMYLGVELLGHMTLYL